MKRSTHLDLSETKGIDIYNEFVKKVKASTYVLCHATSPFISIKAIEEGIHAVIHKKYESSMSVEPIRNHCFFEETPINFPPRTWPRTQDLKPIYQTNSAFFVFTKDLLYTTNSHISTSSCYYVECNNIESIDIDYFSDFQYAEYVIKKNKNSLDIPSQPTDINKGLIRKRITIPFNIEKQNIHVL